VPERLFLGVPLTDDARREIAASLPKVLPGKPVLPENWHFTVRFLGATAAERCDQLVAKLAAATLGPSFDISFGELGAFPNPRRARILWLGVDEGAERFRALARVIEDAARAIGFPAEQRDFTPHLTLSRIDPPTSVVSLLASGVRSGSARTSRGRTGKSAQPAMRVASIVLYRSVLGGGPPRYEELETFPLRT
jgi:RNA 2',3'-cyclic 3'-phosphodiesterase